MVLMNLVAFLTIFNVYGVFGQRFLQMSPQRSRFQSLRSSSFPVDSFSPSSGFGGARSFGSSVTDQASLLRIAQENTQGLLSGRLTLNNRRSPFSPVSSRLGFPSRSSFSQDSSLGLSSSGLSSANRVLVPLSRSSARSASSFSRLPQDDPFSMTLSGSSSNSRFSSPSSSSSRSRSGSSSADVDATLLRLLTQDTLRGRPSSSRPSSSFSASSAGSLETARQNRARLRDSQIVIELGGERTPIRQAIGSRAGRSGTSSDLALQALRESLGLGASSTFPAINTRTGSSSRASTVDNVFDSATRDLLRTLVDPSTSNQGSTSQSAGSVSAALSTGGGLLGIDNTSNSKPAATSLGDILQQATSLHTDTITGVTSQAHGKSPLLSSSVPKLPSVTSLLSQATSSLNIQPSPVLTNVPTSQQLVNHLRRELREEPMDLDEILMRRMLQQLQSNPRLNI